MEAAPGVEHVVAAVRSLYHDPDPKRKEEASKWLNQLQRSVYAWTISDQLLQRKVDVETSYFAAQTMRSKIQTSFHELPAEAHVSLRNSLMDHLTTLTAATSQVIVTQLCLAMADLIILMPEWADAIAELMAKLSGGGETVGALLEVLLLLPEEVDSRHMRIGANRRAQIKQLLTASAPHVTQFLQQMVESGGAGRQVSCVKCYTSWLTLGCVPLASVRASPVMGLAVTALSSPRTPAPLHEASADCLIALLARIEREECAELEVSTVAMVRGMEDSYQLAVAEEESEKCLNYCRVFTELGESFLIKIVSSPPDQPHFSLPILDTVLLCCGHPDYELPDVTFNLWYRLSEELYTRNDDALVGVFKPQVERLIMCLWRHCHMEPDTAAVLEEGEDFAEFRGRVCELVKDCVFIVGSSTVFRQMFQQLQQGQQWEQTEAALFMMQVTTWSLGHLVTWSPGHLVTLLLGHWTPGPHLAPTWPPPGPPGRGEEHPAGGGDRGAPGAAAGPPAPWCTMHHTPSCRHPKPATSHPALCTMMPPCAHAPATNPRCSPCPPRCTWRCATPPSGWSASSPSGSRSTRTPCRPPSTTCCRASRTRGSPPRPPPPSRPSAPSAAPGWPSTSPASSRSSSRSTSSP